MEDTHNLALLSLAGGAVGPGRSQAAGTLSGPGVYSGVALMH